MENLENKNQYIREIFSILTQGVEMLHCETNVAKQISTVTRKIVWMDSDIYRICIDTVRTSMGERSKGKIPHGIYLRDISEIREGTEAFAFSGETVAKNQPNHCLSIIGSERTISLHLPSQFTRDWFYLRFYLLAMDILTAKEKEERKFRLWENYIAPSQIETQNANHMQKILEKGIETFHHKINGAIDRTVLYFVESTSTLELRLYNPKSSIFSKPPEPLEIKLIDISEIRCGSHSLGFVKTRSTNLYDQTLSVIASQNVYNLRFINKLARDLVADRLFQFVRQFTPVPNQNLLQELMKSPETLEDFGEEL